MDSPQLSRWVAQCRQNNRRAQQEVYRYYYNYGMTICCRYAGSREEAKEILNDGFVKVFTRLEKYNEELSFTGWLRKILVNTAIDYYRKNQRQPITVDLVMASEISVDATAIDELSTQEILSLVQQLTPGYRVVFSLYIIDGFNHVEIAEKLGITVGTSKSNLAKARKKLFLLMEANNKDKKKRYG